jgi:hypothetical protein
VATTNALTIFQKVDDPVSFCTAMAKPCAAAAGVPLEQGEAVAMVCLIEGITPYQYRRRYHTTPFGPAMRADAMRAEFRMNHGGDFEIIENTGDCGHIRFTDDKGRVFDSRITWEEAQGEPWPWAKNCGPGTKVTEPTIANLKDNWATPLSRANMLIARATSRGLRVLCPELVAGVYTPEEMGDVIDAAATIVSTDDGKAPRPTAAQLIAQAEAAEAAQFADAVDAEFEPAAQPAATEAAGESEAAAAVDPALEAEAPGTVTAKQRKELAELYEQLAVPADSQTAALRKRGVNSVRSLSKEQADEILGKLREKSRLVKSTAGN